jgi:tRNA-Thr(GGU) m(6)t(6)A37 methyltransferase TsaA
MNQDEGQAITVYPIGKIYSPHTIPQETPLQSSHTCAVGMIEVFPEFMEGLHDIESFSHLILLYHFNRAGKWSLTDKPLSDGVVDRGVFAMRHFSRPNNIGLSIVKILGIRGNFLDVEGVDMLDGTPLLDIKPYVPPFDSVPAASCGWYTHEHLNVIENRGK